LTAHPCPDDDHPSEEEDMTLTIEEMNAKERLHRLVDGLSEDQAEHAHILVEETRPGEQGRRDIDEAVVESYTRVPQFAPDGWADMAKVNEAARDAVLKRLDEEERAAGFEPW
jgi:hypothetical protein